MNNPPINSNEYIPQPHIKNFYKVLSIQNVPITEQSPPLSVSSYEQTEDASDLYIELTLATYSNSSFAPQSKTSSSPNTPSIYLLLSGWWNQTLLKIKDTVFISAYYNYKKQCYVLSTSNITEQDKQDPLSYILNNIIIVEPDIILTPSLIKSGQRCLRAAFFQDKFLFLTSPSVTKPIVIGDIIHLLLEYLLSHLEDLKQKPSLSKDQMENFLLPELERILHSKIFEIHSIQESYHEIYKTTKKFIPVFHILLDRYVKKQHPIEKGLKIKNFVSTETLYQSPLLGLKGIVDCVMEVQNIKTNKTFKAPFEIKTGGQNISVDQIQVIIYCMLLSMELNQNTRSGILAYFSGYSGTVNLWEVKYSIKELIPIFLLRNFIVHYSEALEMQYENIESLVNNSIPSIPTGNGFKNVICDRCYRRQVCQSHFFLCESMKYTHSNNNNNNSNRNSSCSNIEDLPPWAKEGYDEFTSIDVRIKNYFKVMYIAINNYSCENWKKDILQKQSVKRISKSFIDYYKYIIYEYKELDYSFNIKINLSEESSNMDITTEGDLRQSSLVLVYFPTLNTHTFASILDKALNPSQFSISLLKRSIPHSIVDYLCSNQIICNNTQLLIKIILPPNKYADKFSRGNILLLCSNPTKSDIIFNLQQIIIFYKQPTFNCDKSHLSNIMKHIYDNYKNDFLNLNQDQKKALIYSLLCNDFTLIKGFPGSGKSTLITLLVRILHSLGHKILLSSYTNTALDNILIKLKEYNIQFLRVSKHKPSVHPQIHDHLFNSSQFKSISECDKYLSNIRIVGATALGISNPLLQQMNFDYCILDEACQIFEPILLGPLLLSHKFILVGDPHQLTPTFRYDLHPSSGFNTGETANRNLFTVLEHHNPNGCINLEYQYRMNEDVLKLSNECVYNNAMKCASEQLRKSKLNLNVNAILNKDMKVILNPNQSVLLVDYSHLYDKTELDEVSVINVFEGEICLNIYNALVQANFDLKNVGIITLYKEQEIYLQRKINFQIEVMTIDKSQGIEKDLIIVSFVRTNLFGKLLKDIARVNVAFTRAKTKLVVIGLLDVLKSVEKVGKYFELLEQNNWVYYLEKNNLK